MTMKDRIAEYYDKLEKTGKRSPIPRCTHINNRIKDDLKCCHYPSAYRRRCDKCEFTICHICARPLEDTYEEQVLKESYEHLERKYVS